jgi:hypothetical protein
MVNISTTAIAQSITIYCFPPPHKINWSNPHTLLCSTLRNYISKKDDQPLRPLGHIMIELKKDSSYILTGMAPKKKSDLKKNVLKEKEGLGILFDVIDGHLEETELVRTELGGRLKKGKVAFITYNISDMSYGYLRSYLKEYKERGYDRLYNGKNLPRMGEGSGCSAFAMSFLELINALSPELSNDWTIKVNVPEKLIGGRYTDSRISLLRLFFSFRWAGKNEASMPLVLYDPYLMYNWIKAKCNIENANPGGTYAVKKSGNAKGLEVQCASCFPQLPMFTCDTLKNNSASR